MYAWLVDIVTGSSLPLLYSLADTDLGWPTVACILFSALVLSWLWLLPVRRLRMQGMPDHCLDFGSDSVKLVLNIGTLLAQAGQSDPDLGAVLCVAPIFTLICLPGALGPSYEPILQKASAFTGAVLVFVSILYLLFRQGSLVPVEVPRVSWVQAYLQVFLGALCSNDLREGKQVHWSGAGRRAIVFTLLSSSRVFVSSLLRGSANLILWFLHGLLLLQSSLLLARSLRQLSGKMNMKDPSRFSILVNVLLLTAAYAWRETVTRWGAWAGLVLINISFVRLLMDAYA